MAVETLTYGTFTALDVTAFTTLDHSATVGWKSDLIDLRSCGGTDVEFLFDIHPEDAAPAGDKAFSVYVCPAMYTGAAWVYSDGGTTTLPTDGDAAYTIAVPNNLFYWGKIAYTTQHQDIHAMKLLSDIFQSLPDGMLLIMINDTGQQNVSGAIGYRVITRNIA